jgi:hypothetical protein
VKLRRQPDDSVAFILWNFNFPFCKKLFGHRAVLPVLNPNSSLVQELQHAFLLLDKRKLQSCGGILNVSQKQGEKMWTGFVGLVHGQVAGPWAP